MNNDILNDAVLFYYLLRYVVIHDPQDIAKSKIYFEECYGQN